MHQSFQSIEVCALSTKRRMTYLLCLWIKYVAHISV